MAHRFPRPRTLAESLILFGVFVAAFELTCRLEDLVRYGTPFLSPFLSQADLIVADVDGMHGRPEARFQKWVMNSAGMRGPETTVGKPASTIRIVAVGASETFGLYESPRREFPRQLEDSLNARRGGFACAGSDSGAHRFEVLNAAAPGMSLPTVEQDLRRRIHRFAPDAVVLYPSPAQYLDDELPRPAPPGVSPPLSPLRALHPRALERLRSQVKLLLPEIAQSWLRRRETMTYVRSKPPGWRFDAFPSERLSQYEHDLRSFVGIVRAMNAVPVIATHANLFMHPGPTDTHMLTAWEKFFPRAPGSMIVAFDSVARHVTLAVGRDSSVVVADVARAAQERGADKLFTDFSHFTDLGAARAAEILRPAVMTAVESRVCTFARSTQ